MLKIKLSKTCNFGPLFNLEMEIHKEVVTRNNPKNIINHKNSILAYILLQAYE